ncbi:MAG: DUF502 domain-containing protein [Verrucomicrobia bacterium]|nr:DUF502 domain-containing protein [Verrucomicrobiota bacterium]
MVRKYFVTGLVVLLPLALTYWIISFILGVLTDPFTGIATGALRLLGIQSQEVLNIVGKLLALIMLFGLIISIGAIGRYFFFKYLLQLGDAILHRIPVVSAVYKTSQDLIQSMFKQDSTSFKQVVFVQFPHPGAMVVGLVTQEESLDGRIAVFVPTTPNPTTGFLLMYRKEDVIPLDMKVDEALRYIISCGVLMPQIQKSKVP